MSKRHNEICELHVQVAKWLRKNKYVYEYEAWLDKNNRVDFFAHNLPRNKTILCECGNHFNNTDELVDKILQCARYRDIFNDYKVYLFLPNDYHEHDDVLSFLSKYHKIKIIRISVGDFYDNYDKFYEAIYPNYKDDLKPNSGYFKKF